jgi:hypothetical protein
MHAAVHLLHEAGFETLLLTNRLPLRVSRDGSHRARTEWPHSPLHSALSAHTPAEHRVYTGYVAQVSGGYWHPSYNISGWRNCASFNRRLVHPTDFAALLRSYHHHAPPIVRSVYKRGYADDPPELIPDPLRPCDQPCPAMVAAAIADGAFFACILCVICCVYAFARCRGSKDPVQQHQHARKMKVTGYTACVG